MYNYKHDFIILILYVFFFLGDDFYEPSPYEPMTPHRYSDAFRLASIISGKYLNFNHDLFLYYVFIFLQCTALFVVGIFFIALSYMQLSKSSTKLIIIMFQDQKKLVYFL